MKRILILLVCAFALISCENSSVRKGRALYKAYYRKNLRDPNSFVVYEEKYEMDGEYSVNWNIDYGAKNGFGVMVRKQASFTTTSTTIFIDGTGYMLEQLK